MDAYSRHEASMRSAKPAASVTALRSVVLVLMVIPLAIAFVVTSPVPTETREEAAILWALCMIPAWSYLGTQPGTRRPIPFMPLIGGLYGLYYALPAAFGAYNQHYRITLTPQIDYNEAVLEALAGWLMLAAGYGVATLLLPNRRSSPIKASERSWQLYGLVLMLTGLGFDIARRVHPVPVEIAGVLQFLSMLGWFGSGLLVTLSVRGRLSPARRLLTYVGVTAFLVLAIASGSVAFAAFYGTVLITAVWIGRGRLGAPWIVGAVLGMITLISLRGVTEDYRRVVWYQEDGGSQIQNAQLFFRLLEQGVQSEGVDGAIAKGFETSQGRSANLDLFADVIRRTPGEIPYWGGTTYLSLVGSFIPRFLWPNKPTKELGQAFGHRYGYVGSRDSRTAINLPILVEFYANFGFLGVVLGMAVVGMVYRLVDRAMNNPGQDEILSLAGIVLMIPLTNIESDLSLGFGGLIMNGIAFWLVLRTIRRTVARDPGRDASMLSYLTPLAVKPHGS
jgi:hypothetical protein